MNGIKIMIVDDEPRMRTLVRDFLVKDGYSVVEAGDGEEAVSTFTSTKDIALIIMDVMMPVMNGYDASEAIRETSDVPIIMLTAKSTEKDELRGFKIGVDEYITKPFSPKILVARVEAVLRRTNPELCGEKLMAGGIVIDIKGHRVTVDGRQLDLSYKEFELLEFMVRNQGRALTRDSILNNVWDYDYYGDARTIDTHVKKLRAKLGDKGSYIKTIRALGYKFEVE